MHPSRFRRRTVAGVIAVVTAAGVTAIAQSALANPVSPAAVPNSSPQWTAHARALGTTASNTTVDFGVVLKLRNQADAVATLQRISDPDSASYGKWLTNK